MGDVREPCELVDEWRGWLQLVDHRVIFIWSAGDWPVKVMLRDLSVGFAEQITLRSALTLLRATLSPSAKSVLQTGGRWFESNCAHSRRLRESG